MMTFSILRIWDFDITYPDIVEGCQVLLQQQNQFLIDK